MEDVVVDITSGVFDSDSDMCQDTLSKYSSLQSSVLAEVRYPCSKSGCNIF